MEQPYFAITPEWRVAYPDAHVGILVMRGVANPPQHAGLDARKQALEAELRTRYADKAAIKALPVIEAYNAYYRRFEKSYHVQMQLESIVFKGKSLPSVAALVETMFMAETDDLLLTAGHDLDVLKLPVTLDVARGDETYSLLRGTEQITKAGDMLMRDSEGIVSSIIYGPDARTAIRAETTSVMFATYAPPGIGADATRRHLETIRANVLIITPDASTALLHVFGA